MDETTRLLRNAALSDLVADVRSRRAHLELNDPDRQFYLGVEAAAEETLHPELASTRHAEWLERQTAGFRDGYQRTLANIATASTLGEPPVRVLVPEPQHQ
jgi:hypothetical protein